MIKTVEEIGPEAGRTSATRLVPDRYTTFELSEASNGAFRTCRVLQYYADGMHHAHELDMHLVGYVDPPEEALARLRTTLTKQDRACDRRRQRAVAGFPRTSRIPATCRAGVVCSSRAGSA